MKKYIILFLIFFVKNLLAVKIGSNYSVLRINYPVDFPKGEKNEITGFTSLTKGFLFEDSTVSCTYDAFFPITGNLSFNGGMLFLNQDLNFDNYVKILNSGSLYGNSHSIIFPESLTAIDLLQSGNTLSSLAAQSPGVINSVDWLYDTIEGYYYIAIGRANDNPNPRLQVFRFNGTSLELKASSNWNRNNSVKWRPKFLSNVYIAAGGRRWGSGEQQSRARTYKFNPPSSLSVIETLTFMNEFEVRALAWDPGGKYLAISSIDSPLTPVKIYSITSDGYFDSLVASSSLELDVSNDAIDWAPDGKYLAVGSDKLYIFYFDGSSLVLKDSIDTRARVNALDWSNTTSLIATGFDSGDERLRIYEFNYDLETLVEKESARVGENLSILSCNWRFDDRYLAIGRENDSARTELAIFDFDIENYQLSYVAGANARDKGNVNSARWSHDGLYIAAGDSYGDLTIYKFTDYPNVNFTFDNVELNFNSDINFNARIYFQGNSILNGNNYTLNLTSSGSLILKENSSLLLYNINIKGVGGENIGCLDGSGEYIFQDAVLCLKNDYNFNKGSFKVLDSLRIKGDCVFSYSSDQVSSILPNSSLFLDFGMTFSYSPIISSDSLLNMVDESSTLYLDGSRFYVGESGLSLTKGSLIIGRRSYLRSEGSKGVAMGDGIDSKNNFRIIGDYNLVLTEGSVLNYKNIE